MITMSVPATRSTHTIQILASTKSLPTTTISSIKPTRSVQLQTKVKKWLSAVIRAWSGNEPRGLWAAKWKSKRMCRFRACTKSPYPPISSSSQSDLGSQTSSCAPLASAATTTALAATTARLCSKRNMSLTDTICCPVRRWSVVWAAMVTRGQWQIFSTRPC